MRPLLLLAAAASVTAAAATNAWPVLAGGRATPAGACYPDHLSRDLWWLAPPTPVVKLNADGPAIALTQFRYTGTRATRDQGTFWGRGLLQVTLEFPRPGALVQVARASLPGGARVEAMAPAVVDAEVVFAGADATPPRPVGGAAAKPDATKGAAWEEQSFSVSVAPEMTQVLWEASERGAVALSVNVSVSAVAYAALPPPGEKPAAPTPLPVMADAVAVTLDRQRYPHAVRLLELDATMAAGYTFLELGCSELAEGSGFSDLAVVVATVAARAVNGDRITQEVRFDASSEPVRSVTFDRAVRLDAGYDVTVHRVYASGRSSDEVPRHVEVWSGFFNVCPASGAIDALDSRLLY